MATGRVAAIIQAGKAISKRLVFSYGLDWLVLIIFGIIAYAFTFISPHYRPFSLLDLSIAYPYHTQTVSIAEVAAGCVLGPAAIVAIVVLVFVPGPAACRRMSSGEILRIKMWEFNVGWLGLALAHVIQFLFVQGIKNLLGKPRPNLLSRCQPDLTSIADYTVGGYGQDISDRWVLVDHRICTQTDTKLLDDGFRSFPSGHNSTAFAGMLYLSLYLASKFGIAFPTIPFHKRDAAGLKAEKRSPPPFGATATGETTKARYRDYRQFGYRDEAAAAPMWTIVFIVVPMAVAIYIGGSRYFDYYHDGFDILFGSFIGLLAGYIGFRWYHGPIGRSAGWAWSPRSRDRAFGIGVGTLGYVTEFRPQEGINDPSSIELGLASASLQDQSRYARQRSQYETLGSSGTEQ